MCVIEKASTIGAQILSGAVIETGPLDALLPDWRKDPPPICVDAKDDEFWLLSRDGGRKLPVPPGMNNHGNVIVSLGAMCAWLAPQAEALGVEIYRASPRRKRCTTRPARCSACASATWAWPRMVRTSPATRPASTSARR